MSVRYGRAPRGQPRSPGPPANRRSRPPPRRRIVFPSWCRPEQFRSERPTRSHHQPAPAVTEPHVRRHRTAHAVSARSSASAFGTKRSLCRISLNRGQGAVCAALAGLGPALPLRYRRAGLALSRRSVHSRRACYAGALLRADSDRARNASTTARYRSGSSTEARWALSSNTVHSASGMPSTNGFTTVGVISS
jgi:hypothetical protein